MGDDDLDDLVRVVASSTRRRILGLCSGGFVPAGEVATHIDLAPASVSEHLKVLRKSGLVELERSGTRWMYTTNTEALDHLVARLARDLPTHRRQ